MEALVEEGAIVKQVNQLINQNEKIFCSYSCTVLLTNSKYVQIILIPRYLLNLTNAESVQDI